MLGFKLTHVSKRGTGRIRAIYSPIKTLGLCHCLMSAKWSGTWHKNNKTQQVGAMYILFWDKLYVCRLLKPMFIYQSVKNQRTAFKDLPLKMVRVFLSNIYDIASVLMQILIKRDIFVSRKVKSFGTNWLFRTFSFSSLISFISWHRVGKSMLIWFSYDHVHH